MINTGWICYDSVKTLPAALVHVSSLTSFSNAQSQSVSYPSYMNQNATAVDVIYTSTFKSDSEYNPHILTIVWTSKLAY